MKIKLVSALALASCLCLGSGAAESHWSINTGLRMHARILDEAGRSYQITLLTRSRGRNEVEGIIKRHAVLLIEGGHAGRWVYETDCNATIDFHNITVTSTLVQPGGALALKVEYITSNGEGKGRYVLETPKGIRTFSESDMDSVPAGGNSELLECLSEPSKEILSVLRALAHDKGSWHVEPTFLAPFFGSADLGPAKTLQMQPLPVDCIWDEAFGFPCEESEQPERKGEVYIKKLSP